LRKKKIVSVSTHFDLPLIGFSFKDLTAQLGIMLKISH
jgi:hypothetical protein